MSEHNAETKAAETKAAETKAAIVRIEKLREKEEIAEALDAALGFIETGGRHTQAGPCWNAVFQGERGCLLLDFARAEHPGGKEFAGRIKRVLDRFEDEAFLKKLPAPRELVKARVGLLRAFLLDDENVVDDKSPDAARDRIECALRAAIDAYDDQWKIGSPPENAEYGLVDPLPGVEGLREVFKKIARQRGRTPGLLAVRDTVASLYAPVGAARGPYPRAIATVPTWVLAVANLPEIGGRGTYKEGLLGRLVLERIENGAGAVYPHPQTAGYLSMREDFRQGIADALRCAAGGVRLDFDVRFRLDVRDPQSGLLVGATLEGRSAEVAWACALRALRDGEQLDAYLAVTAQFRRTEGGQLIDDSRWLLQPVENVDYKLLAEELRRKHVEKVLVATGQPELVTLAHSRVPPVEVNDFDAAWDQMSRFRRMTRLACESLAKDAAAGLLKECEGEYIMPSISRLRTEGGRRGPNSEAEPHDPLSNDEIAKVVLGRYATCVRILAPSGLGKSTLLLHCQREIAKVGDGRLPILIKPISDFTWESTSTNLADHPVVVRLARKFNSGHDGFSVAEYRAWLARLIENGEVVWLLDALRQTRSIEGSRAHRVAMVFGLLDALRQTSSMEGLAAFFRTGTGEVTRCPVILIGRPYVAQSGGIADAFSGDWKTLRLEPIDRKRQAQFPSGLVTKLVRPIRVFASVAAILLLCIVLGWRFRSDGQMPVAAALSPTPTADDDNSPTERGALIEDAYRLLEGMGDHPPEQMTAQVVKTIKDCEVANAREHDWELDYVLACLYGAKGNIFFRQMCCVDAEDAWRTCLAYLDGIYQSNPSWATVRSFPEPFRWYRLPIGWQLASVTTGWATARLARDNGKGNGPSEQTRKEVHDRLRKAQNALDQVISDDSHDSRSVKACRLRMCLAYWANDEVIEALAAVNRVIGEEQPPPGHAPPATGISYGICFAIRGALQSLLGKSNEAMASIENASRYVDGQVDFDGVLGTVLLINARNQRDERHEALDKAIANLEDSDKCESCGYALACAIAERSKSLSDEARRETDVTRAAEELIRVIRRLKGFPLEIDIGAVKREPFLFDIVGREDVKRELKAYRWSPSKVQVVDLLDLWHIAVPLKMFKFPRHVNQVQE